MTETDDAKLNRLAQRFDESLPDGTRGMLITYNETGKDLEVSIFASATSQGELVRILAATTNAARGSAVGPPARMFEPLEGDHRSLVSSVGIDQMDAHEYVRVWNRGGLAGQLVVSKGDGEKIVALLGLMETPT